MRAILKALKRKVNFRRPSLVVLILLVVLNVCLFWRVLTPSKFDRVLISGGDFLSYILPKHVHLSMRLHNGNFPWWNPLEFGGQPFAADPTSWAFYPPTLLGCLLAPPEHPYRVAYVTAVVQIAHLVLSGWGMFLLLRRFGCIFTASLFGAIAWNFSHALIGRCGHIHIQFPWSWLPFLLLSFDLACGKRSHRAMWVGGAILGAIMLGGGGFSNVVFLSLLLLSLYLVFRCAQAHWTGEGPSSWNMVRALAAMVAIGLGIAAMQLLPGSEFAAVSNRAVTKTLAYASLYSVPPRFLLKELLLPENAYYEAASYTGLVTALVAGFGFVLIRRPVKWFLLGIAVLGALIATGRYSAFLGPLYYWWTPVNFRVPARALGLTAFGLAALGGLSLDAFVRGARNNSRRSLGVALNVAGLAWGVALLGYLFYLSTQTFANTDPAFMRASPLDSLAVALVVSGGTLACLASVVRATATRALGTVLVVLLTVDLFHWGHARYLAHKPRVHPGPQEFIPKPVFLPWKESLAARELHDRGYAGRANIAPYYHMKASPAGYNALQIQRYMELVRGVRLGGCGLRPAKAQSMNGSTYVLSPPVSQNSLE